MKTAFPLFLGLRFLLGRAGAPKAQHGAAALRKGSPRKGALRKKGRWGLSPYLRGSVVGIGLSLVPLIVVLEVSDGMIEGITRRYLEIGTYHLQVNLPREPDDELVDDYRRVLAETAEVRGIYRERQGMALLYSPAGRYGATLRAVPPDLRRNDVGFREYFSLEEGRFDLDREDAILLGREVARILGVGVGDEVKILTTRPGRRSGFIPRVSTATVTGIFSSGYQELDKLWAFLPLETGLKILAPENARDFLGVKLADPFTRLESQAARLEQALPGASRVYTWYELEQSNYRSFQTTRALLLFIMAMIVAVAAINVSSSLIMVVLERRMEIGILKSIGARPAAVSAALVFTGFLTGLAGAILGIGFGLAVAVNINEIITGTEWLLNLLARGAFALLHPLLPLQSPGPIRIFNAAFYLERIPIRVQLPELLLASSLTILLATLAAWFPARRAGKIRPLEVLRRH